MSKLAWYWHRLRAMSAREIALHVQKKFRQFADARREREWGGVELKTSGVFPLLPKPEDAPEVLRKALKQDAENILAGRWKAFGHLDLEVDDPPKWHCDYLVGKDLATSESAFKLNHRELPGGADIKLIWELSRWHQLVRLAMAAYVLGEERAGEKCVFWLEDWVKHNPPYRGWNWTSALEVGIRLIQFSWIDALLGTPQSSLAVLNETNAPGRSSAMHWRLEALRYSLLSPHVSYAWRNMSFGSSANNHLIGELAGLIVATVRWPALAQWGVPLEELQRRWEHEVLAQFAEDGGNKEQALNYHLFSWEFSWQAMAALRALGRDLSRPVVERLYNAGNFFVNIQVDEDPWDYGDSDSANVTPFGRDLSIAALEWREWMIARASSPAIDYWLGTTRDNFHAHLREFVSGGRSEDFKTAVQPTVVQTPKGSSHLGWLSYVRSGQWVCRTDRWTCRWDLSPLGHLSTAAHGHLDAQHLSIWIDKIAVIIDPGTGVYYTDGKLRTWLASRGAHNGPCPIDRGEWPRRLGPFLWEEAHEPPAVDDLGPHGLWSLMKFPNGTIHRSVDISSDGFSIMIRDEPGGGRPHDFTVRWQFAPDSAVELVGDRQFRITRRGVTIEAKVSPDWAEVFLVTDQSQKDNADPGNPLAGIVSSAFRKTVWAPYLKLVARPGDQPCVFRTTFQTSPRS